MSVHKLVEQTDSDLYDIRPRGAPSKVGDELSPGADKKFSERYLARYVHCLGLQQCLERHKRYDLHFRLAKDDQHLGPILAEHDVVAGL
jgi:hypothetical protein